MSELGNLIYKAIREGKALEIIYNHESDGVKKATRFYCGIDNIESVLRDNKTEWMLTIKGMKKDTFSSKSLTIYMSKIIGAVVCDSIIYSANDELVQDIDMNPEKYSDIFGDISNLNILSYLEECYYYNQATYLKPEEYKTVEGIDLQKVKDIQSEQTGECSKDYSELSIDKNQMSLLKKFSKNSDGKKSELTELCLNAFSIIKGNVSYPIAYWKVYFDLKSESIIIERQLSLCRELLVENEDEKSDKGPILFRYLREDEYQQFESEENIEAIGDAITKRLKDDEMLSEEPYLFRLSRDINSDFALQFAGIEKSFRTNELSMAMNLFLGKEKGKLDEVKRNYTLALISKMVDPDQLMAIDNAMTMPISRIQGPPGTGKTTAIINTIITAFFNGKTVLFSSMNNKPVRDVFNELTSMEYDYTRIPFPVLRVGNGREMSNSIKQIKEFCEWVEVVTVDNKEITSLKKEKRINACSKAVIKRVQTEGERKQLQEQIEYLENLNKADEEKSSGYEKRIKSLEKKLSMLPELTNEELDALFDYDEDDVLHYLYLCSVKLLQKIGKDSQLHEIFLTENTKNSVKLLRELVKSEDGLKKLQEVFPVILSTNLSTAMIGNPKSYFDLCIIDEAGQCDICASLLPIIRGESLMLVGDPQQLRPVLLISSKNNDVLKKRYQIGYEHDFAVNSIYSSYSYLDTLGNEIMLHNHYRCNKKIVEFANQKYYGGKLHVYTPEEEEGIPSLEYVDMGSVENEDDLSPKEASIVLDRYMSIDRRKYTVGIITPFRANADRICQGLMRLGIDNAYEVCGTVHSFQGDQKDIILLSSSINKSTRKGTYSWLSRNSELINVASTRAKKSLILFSDDEKLNELHEMISKENTDDWYDFAQYIKSNGEITSFQGYKDPRIEKICEENENTDAVLAKTIKNVTDRMKSKNEIELKEMVSPHDVFSSSDGAEVGKIWGKVLRTVVYENNKPVIVIEQSDVGDKEGAIALSSLEKKKSFCEAEGITFLQIPNSYARRYNLIYNQIEKLIK